MFDPTKYLVPLEIFKIGIPFKAKDNRYLLPMDCKQGLFFGGPFDPNQPLSFFAIIVAMKTEVVPESYPCYYFTLRADEHGMSVLTKHNQRKVCVSAEGTSVYLFAPIGSLDGTQPCGTLLLEQVGPHTKGDLAYVNVRVMTDPNWKMDYTAKIPRLVRVPLMSFTVNGVENKIDSTNNGKDVFSNGSAVFFKPFIFPPFFSTQDKDESAVDTTKIIHTSYTKGSCRSFPFEIAPEDVSYCTQIDPPSYPLPSHSMPMHRLSSFFSSRYAKGFAMNLGSNIALPMNMLAALIQAEEEKFTVSDFGIDPYTGLNRVWVNRLIFLPLDVKELFEDNNYNNSVVDHVAVAVKEPVLVPSFKLNDGKSGETIASKKAKLQAKQIQDDLAFHSTQFNEHYLLLEAKSLDPLPTIRSIFLSPEKWQQKYEELNSRQEVSWSVVNTVDITWDLISHERLKTHNEVMVYKVSIPKYQEMLEVKKLKKELEAMLAHPSEPVLPPWLDAGDLIGYEIGDDSSDNDNDNDDDDDGKTKEEGV